MEEERDFYRVVEEICVMDKRYRSDSYEFLMHALYYTQRKLDKKGHIGGRELLEGIREFIIEQYGPLAKAVLNHWGIFKTDDFGNIVFNLIGKKILSKTDTDSLSDFKDLYNFDEAFSNILQNSLTKDNG
ncbi:MAG: Minf_1886 family protein [Candidatus Omnitrophota bacterium]